MSIVSHKKEMQIFPLSREPKLHVHSHLHLLNIFGWNSLFIVLGCFGSMGYGIIPIVSQYLLGSIIDASPTDSREIAGNAVNTLSIQLAILACGGAIAFAIHHFFWQLASAGIGASMRKAYMLSMSMQDLNFFKVHTKNSLSLIMSKDIPKIQDFYSKELLIFMQEITQFLVGFILSMTVDYQMALILVSTTPVTFTFHIVLSIIASSLKRKIHKCTDKLATYTIEIVSCMRTIRSMAGEEKEVKKYNKDLRRIDTLGLLWELEKVAYLDFLFLLHGQPLHLVSGGHKVIDGKTTIGSIFKVFGMMFIGIVALFRAATFFPRYGKVYISETTFLKVALRTPEIPFKGGKTLEKLEGEILFNNVYFSYPTEPNSSVVTNFNLKIKSGQTVALVGPLGSGKSTIIGLLERFYTPNKGFISIDGVDISELDPMWMHHHCMGIVSKEPVFITGSIKYNIAYSLLGVSEDNERLESTTMMEQIEIVATKANAHHFIMELPEKYETLLGESGISLSRGQKQRIAIARTFLQDPKILLLDEATYGMDSESERLVQAALEELMKGRTTLCIAHRLTEIVNADLICVLVGGSLVEQGTHHELIRIKDGMYKNLTLKQAMIEPEDVFSPKQN